MDHINQRTPLLSDSGGDAPPVANADADYVTRFRQAVGINATTSPSHNDDLESSRRRARGIYKQTISAQKWRQRQYLFVEAVFYLALLSNIVIGAAFAALSTTSLLHPMVITILGIVNSSMAGILALLKGQNLPDRLRKDEFEMRKVQDFIEEMETRLAFGLVDGMNDKELSGLVKEVFDRYDVARDTAEMNRPASYVHQIEVLAGDDSSTDQGVIGDSDGVVRTTGLPQSRLALSSGKGKALVIS